MICNSLRKHVVSYLIGLNFFKRGLQIALANWQNIAKSNLSVLNSFGNQNICSEVGFFTCKISDILLGYADVITKILDTALI